MNLQKVLDRNRHGQKVLDRNRHGHIYGPSADSGFEWKNRASISVLLKALTIFVYSRPSAQIKSAYCNETSEAHACPRVTKVTRVSRGQCYQSDKFAKNAERSVTKVTSLQRTQTNFGEERRAKVMSNHPDRQFPCGACNFLSITLIYIENVYQV